MVGALLGVFVISWGNSMGSAYLQLHALHDFAVYFVAGFLACLYAVLGYRCFVGQYGCSIWLHQLIFPLPMFS